MADGDDFSLTSWNTGDWTAPSVPIGDGSTVLPSTNAISSDGGGGITPAAAASAMGANPPAGGGTLGGNLANWVTQNPGNALGVLAGGGMLASEAFGGSDQKTEMNLLQQNATGAGTMATALQAPLFSGVLPTGAQTALDTARGQQIAQVRSSYARAGMAGSTGEADAINTVNQNIAAQRFGIEMNMFSQAAQYAKLNAADLGALLQEQRAQDQDFSNALSKFVSALAGSGLGTPASGGGGGSNAGAAPASSSPSLASAIGDSFSSIGSFFGIS